MSQRPLRILHLTAGSDAGGLSRYIHDLCAAMQARGHEVAVAGERGAWHWLFADAPWPWIDAPLKAGPLGLRKAAATIGRWLAEHPVDVLHTHYRRATLAARRLRSPAPIVYTVHLSGIRLKWPWRLLTDFGDITHAPSEEAADWVRDAGVPDEKIALVHHGVDTARYAVPTPDQRRRAREELGISADARVAAYVGRLDWPKNTDWLIDLAAASRSALPGLRIILAGQGPHEERLRLRIARDQLTDRVMLLGHRDPLPIYQAADAVLLPSSREGFSYACAEAMSVGVPVLRTATAGTRAMIVEGITGRAVPVDRSAFVAAGIEMLADGPGLVRMGQAAASHIRERFGFERQVEQTLDLYRRAATLARGR